MKKNENLVLTISVGDHYKKVASLSEPLMKNYAKKIKADFLNITEDTPEYITQKWLKFNIHNLLHTYKRILYVDTDILIREDAPNLFEVVPENKLGMFNEGRYVARYEFLEQASEYYGELS